MVKGAKKRKKLLRSKKQSVSDYKALTADRAFVTLVQKLELKSAIPFLFNDGVGTYSLWKQETECVLQCVVGNRVVYRKFFKVSQMISQLKLEDQKKFEKFWIAVKFVSTKSSTRLEKTEAGASPPMSKKLHSADKKASENFRASTRAQVIVRSRLPSDDVRGGRSPGHVGDLK